MAASETVNLPFPLFSAVITTTFDSTLPVIPLGSFLTITTMDSERDCFHSPMTIITLDNVGAAQSIAVSTYANYEAIPDLSQSEDMESGVYFRDSLDDFRRALGVFNLWEKYVRCLATLITRTLFLWCLNWPLG